MPMKTSERNKETRITTRHRIRLIKMPPLARRPIRKFVRRFASLLMLLTLSWIVLASAPQARSNVIEDENLQAGTTAWQLTNPAENRQIEGYASLTSVPVGGDIQLFVNTKDSTYSLTIYRMGWYQGKGGRKVVGPVTLNGVQQVTPTADPTTLLIECHWTNPYTIHVPTSWVSGIYLAKLHGNTSGKESYISFTVRDTRNADIVFQQSVATYQAYNPWPGYDPVNAYVGASLYGYQSNFRQATQVSFNRPYGRGIQTNSLYGVGAGDFLTHDFSPVFNPEADLASGTGGTSAWEFCMIRWLEHHAYDVTYITSVDTHEDVNRLLRGKAFLSVGHDEYWTEQMKTNVFAARDQGVNLGFFSGNYVYWPVAFLADSNGMEDRTLAMAPKTGVCAAPAEIDCSVDSDCPTNLTCQNNGQKYVCSPAKTTLCSVDADCPGNLICQQKSCDFNCLGESEQLLTGGMWDNGHLANGDIVVSAAPLSALNHWVFANTGLQVGDVIPGLIGYEYDAYRSDSPAPSGLKILLQTQAPGFGGEAFFGAPFPSNFDGKSFDAWYDSLNLGALETTCDRDPIAPFGILPPAPLCSNPYPQDPGLKTDWAMTIYQAGSGAWVFNAATVQWSWGLDDYFTGLTTSDGANNGPAVRTQCGYPWFHPGLVSCRNDAVAQITRNVLNKFQPADTTAPQSSLTIGTPQYTSSTAQLFVAAATPFTVTATDDATGVWNVWYRFFPSGTSAPTYTSVEGFLANFTLSDPDGSFEVDSYATDNAGNDESPAHVQTVYLDTTPPVTTISQPVAKQYLHSDTFTISYTVDDGTGSGVKSAIPDIDGKTTLSNGTTQYTVANGLMVTLLTELTLGPHTFNVNSTDNVDNADTAAVTFSIIVTAQSIKDEVKYFRSIGAITQDEATSLLQKLNLAASYRTKHDCKDANSVYYNFIKELRAQTGKKVTAQAAAILIADAQYLIEHCP
jgi:hypothetical protein